LRREIEVQFLDHAAGELLWSDVASFKELDRFRTDPAIANLRSIGRIGQHPGQLVESRKIDQHAAEIEEQNVECAFCGHRLNLAREKGAPEDPAPFWVAPTLGKKSPSIVPAGVRFLSRRSP
jgi:hypothetical protein